MRERVRRLLTPPVRAYIRYVPFGMGKRAFWNRVVEPNFAWHPHRFVASTVFGSRIAGDTSDIIQQYIYYFGVWEPHLTRWIGLRLAPGDTFIDVGANIGYFSLLASKLVGDSGVVVAIEASPRTFGLLQANLARNLAQNVRTVNVAASDRKGRVGLFRGPDDNIGLTTVLGDPRLAFECEVDAAPLSHLLRPEEAQTARLIKIDVEGAEWSVVAGMDSLLRAGRRDLEVIVEVTPEHLAQQGKRPEDLVRVFRDAGFQAYRLENDYSPQSYLPPCAERRPERIRTPIQWQTDVVFSRQDSELL
ncbi:MAG TPA: FkbM family methyltransferase [Candidatus Methylomirabilis sp.]|nr:FkbM family methyltransferase [Candidatus Methylomirabilis sp.]